MAFGYYFPKKLSNLLLHPQREYHAWRRGQDNLLKRLHVSETFRLLDIGKEDNVLELGAGGIPYYAAAMSRKAQRVVACDIAPYFGASFFDRRIPSTLHLIRCNAQNLSFTDAYFDKIFISELLSVLPDPDECISEAFRVLKPKGSIVLVHGTIFTKMHEAVSTERGQRLIDIIQRKWGIPQKVEDLIDGHIKYHGVAASFFLDRDKYVFDILTRHGFEIAETTWRIYPDTELEYCLLLLESLAETGEFQLGAGQIIHLKKCMKLEKNKPASGKGMTMFCKATKP